MTLYQKSVYILFTNNSVFRMYVCLEKMLLYWSVDPYNNVWKRVVEKGVDRKGLILRNYY